MRYFFGLPVTGVINNAAQQLVSTYRDHCAMKHIHWTPPTNWHLTLRFLGEATEEQRSAFCEHATKIAAKINAFEITPNGILMTPQRRPRVFCLSVRLNDSLADLYRLMHQASLEIGFAPEKRPFVPHVTVGRWETSPQIEINKLPVAQDNETIDRFHLYTSESGENGSIYTPVESFELA